MKWDPTLPASLLKPLLHLLQQFYAREMSVAVQGISSRVEETYTSEHAS